MFEKYKNLKEFKEKGVEDNGPKFKMTNLSYDLDDFLDECKSWQRSSSDGVSLIGNFNTTYLRNKLRGSLKQIKDHYEAKADKHGAVTIAIAFGKWRRYLVLYTNPKNQVLAWHWWLDESTELKYEVDHTFE